MTAIATDTIERHRRILRGRPELREAYRELLARLLAEVRDRRPILEVGAGPGFLKECCPDLIATDVVASPWIDAACDAGRLPFQDGAIGAVVLLDVLHHLPRPMESLREVSRVLRPGGRVAAIEPWITPFSYLMYRFLHHEDCRLGVDLTHPFDGLTKRAFDGNAAIPFALFRHLSAHPYPLSLIRAEPFVGLPYLFTFGFKRSRPVPGALVAVARALERLTGPARKLAATRVVAVWGKSTQGRPA